MSQGTSSEEWSKKVIHGQYRPHIDGLRAWAVLPVVLYHLYAALCPGGFAGVDVFFVISGYLIVGGIVRDLGNKSFTLTGFYYRRVRRIIPAYVALICAVLLAGCLLFSYQSLETLSLNALYSTFWGANLFCRYYLGDYFNPDVGEAPLLNLWSLGIEEQFYVGAPLTILLVWKYKRRWLPWVLFILCAASLWQATKKVWSGKETAAFYGLFPRIWELLAGALLALMPSLPAKLGRWKPALAVVGLGILVFPYVAYTGASPFPGVYALPSVAGAMLLIACGDAGWVGRVLQSGPCVGIGKISYSLYLWHWPVFVFWNYAVYGSKGWFDFGGMLLLSFAAAYASWRWIEMPVRVAKIPVRRAFAAALICCGLLAAASGVLVLTNGGEHWLHTRINRYKTESHKAWPAIPFKGGFGITPPNGAVPVSVGYPIDCPENDRSTSLVQLGDATATAPSYVLVGDSHALALAPGFEAFSQRTGIAGLYVRSQLTLLYGIRVQARDVNPPCIEALVDWLARQPAALHTVVLSNIWAQRCHGRSLDEEFRQQKRDPDILYRAGEEPPADATANPALFEEGLRNLCRAIVAQGRRVVIVGPVPEHPWNVPEYFRKRLLLDFLPCPPPVTERDYLAREKTVFDVFERLQRDGLARVLWIHPALIDKGVIRMNRGETLLYRDSNHLSLHGGIELLRLLQDDLRTLLTQPQQRLPRDEKGR